jgi:hypothetical protein|tara:strand:- start:4198 stop:4530 length:333 start_codon:yes stop_codon:yes gene_type:complete
MAKGEDNPIIYDDINVASGTTAIITAVAGRRFRVLGYTVVANAATGIQFVDEDGTAITGNMQLAAKGGLSPNATYIGQFETPTVNKELRIICTEDVDGHMAYQEFEEITT